MKKICITITGDPDASMTQLVEQVILPALKEAGDSFTYKYDEELVHNFVAPKADTHVTVIVNNAVGGFAVNGGA